MMDNIAIKVDNLTKIYKLYEKPVDRLKESLHPLRQKYHRDFYALKNISFEVMKGETVGIIGKNGSGKSTLLKIITGVLTQSLGNVRVNGKVSALLELGAGFNPELTGTENIYINGMIMGYTREEMDARLEDILTFADIGEFVQQPVKTYSSGMFARLAFAVAINVEPDILVVDEALAVGDTFFQNKCFRKFDELRQKGVTILFVSHDIESVKQMCSRVLWIEQGVKVLFGDRIEVCNNYARSYLLENNKLVGNEGKKNELYKVDKFELKQYPGIYVSKESLCNPNVVILSCFFEDFAGKLINNVIGNEYYRLVIIFKTEIQLNNCIVGYVLQNKKGVAIINSNTLITGQKKNFTAKAHSIYRVEFLMRFPCLATDEYILDCAVADGLSVMDSTMYTWLYGAIKFMINNPEKGLAILDVDAEVTIYEKESQVNA